jgi:branched-chain amino acid transport system substrate-binding protein
MGLIGLGAGSIDAWAEDGAIRLGIVAPMSGPNSRYGSYSLRGAQLAAEEINSAGGIGGRKIAITSGDSQGTPVEGVSATRRLIDLDKVDFIIGDVSSSVTLAMQPVAEDAGVLLLNAASSNPKITYAAGVGRLQMDVPQLSDRCRPHRHPICRREKRLHEVCCSLRR